MNHTLTPAEARELMKSLAVITVVVFATLIMLMPQIDKAMQNIGRKLSVRRSRKWALRSAKENERQFKKLISRI